MAKSYNQTLKDQILSDMKESGLSAYEAAKKYEINVNTIYKWLKDACHSGTTVKDLLKENKQLKAQVEVLCGLVKKFSIDSAKKK